MELLPQNKFPFLKQFKCKFGITERSVFAYDGNIYSNYKLPPDILIHELHHFKQQRKIGAKEWIKRYLADDDFRLNQELGAYRVQLNSIPDREERNRIRMECAEHLSSSLYGDILTYQDAFKSLS